VVVHQKKSYPVPFDFALLPLALALQAPLALLFNALGFPLGTLTRFLLPARS
jgi:hypothetical protein